MQVYIHTNKEISVKSFYKIVTLKFLSKEVSAPLRDIFIKSVKIPTVCEVKLCHLECMLMQMTEAQCKLA